MAREFKLPDLGEGIHEGEVLAVKVGKGEQVQEDETILEVETDKAAVEIPSPYTDVVTDVRVSPGDIVHVGDVMMVFGGTSENVPREKPRAEEKEDAREKAPSKAKPEAGKPHRGERPVPAAPSTRRLARELGVDLHEVPPTGPFDRVTAEDVRAHAEGGPQKEKAPETAPKGPSSLLGVSPQQVEAPSLPSFSEFGEVERVPLRSVRRATARQMALSWSQIPHVSTQDSADITQLEALRRRYADEVEAKGGSLTLTVFVLKALTNALQAFPRFNASLDLASEEVVLKKYYHIGVAVDTERGLIVPVIRNVDQKSITQLAIELRDLALRTRDGKAGLEEMRGGTMTITNIGALGGTHFSPIINYPEVAILGLARAKIEPVARKQVGPAADEAFYPWTEAYEFVPRLMLPVILAFDHRVNDGADAQRFVNAVIEQLENPEKLLLGL
jgi:pyruvate dehydrogenase E2 component (dihydrolipoamide acetyltransferase)